MPPVKGYHLDQTISKLQGASKEQLIVFNQWAAVALDLYHKNSTALFEFTFDKKNLKENVAWNSNFNKGLMRERKHIAEDGGVGLAFFLMSVLLKYRYVQQSEIGEGVDYGFQTKKPSSKNFFKNCHFV